ncbi:Diels-Alderase phmD [Paramyrothecium foliicola]|nr:Diels-Alderase phmD [Paramyrothecium foliicola]
MLPKKMRAGFIFWSSILLQSTYSSADGDDAGWARAWGTSEEQLAFGSEGCTVSRMTRYGTARGRKPVSFSTGGPADLEAPSIEPLNSTAGEQWEFDGTADDGTRALCFGFYRDPNYSFFGSGNLRVYAEFAHADGSRYAIVDYAEESIVESCPGPRGGTRGLWKGDGWVYEFKVSADMKHVRVTMDNPEAKATVVFNSQSQPRYANNEVWPSRDGSTLTVPHFYWTEPVPVAKVQVYAVIHGKEVAWTGMGGHERLWGAFNWFTCLAGMTAVRILAGPYALSLVGFESARELGLHVPAIILFEDGRKVFASRVVEPSETEDFFEMRKLYSKDGVTTKALSDKMTGVELTLHSPSRRLRWQFVIEHKIVGFEYDLGDGMGGTAYSGIAVGGLVGSKSWSGPAFSEAMKMPNASWIIPNNFVY